MLVNFKTLGKGQKKSASWINLRLILPSQGQPFCWTCRWPSCGTFYLCQIGIHRIRGHNFWACQRSYFYPLSAEIWKNRYVNTNLEIYSNHKCTKNWLKVRDGHEIIRLSKSLTVYYSTILNEKNEEVTQLSVYFIRSLRNILISCSATSRGCVITYCDVIMTYTVCVSCVYFIALEALPGRYDLFHFLKFRHS